jgi:hypothetical protein
LPRLIWKEWHEQSWKLGFSCVVLGAAAVIGLRCRIISDQAMIAGVCIAGLCLLPILAATGLVPAERADETLESLLALPVRPWKILLVKTAMGSLLCAGPMAAAAVLSWLVAGGRELPSEMTAIVFARSTLAAISLFVWMMALTIHLPNETRAGLLSLGVLIFWLVAEIGLDAPSTPPVLLTISPLGFVYGGASSDPHKPAFAAVLAVQGAIVVALWFWANKRLTAGVEERP